MSVEPYEAWLDGDQLICIKHTMTPAARDAVLKSALYFQLYASTKVERLSDPHAWFHKFEDVTRNFGWQVVERGEYASKPTAFDLNGYLVGFDTAGTVATIAGLQWLFARQASHAPLPELLQRARQSRAGDDVVLMLGNAHGDGRLDTLMINFKVAGASVEELLCQDVEPLAIQGEVNLSWLCSEPHPLLFPRFQPVIEQRLAKRIDQAPVLVDMSAWAKVEGDHV